MKCFIITICLVLFSSPLFACDDCEGYWENIYRHKRVQQKHEYLYRYRQALIDGKIAYVRAKQNQKVRKRINSTRYYSGDNVSFYMIP